MEDGSEQGLDIGVGKSGLGCDGAVPRDLVEIRDGVDCEAAAGEGDVGANLGPANANVDGWQTRSREGTRGADEPAVGVGEGGANTQGMSGLGWCSSAAVQGQLEEVAAEGGVDGDVSGGGGSEVEVGAGAKGEMGGRSRGSSGVGRGVGHRGEGGLKGSEQTVAELAADGEDGASAGVDAGGSGEGSGKRTGQERCGDGQDSGRAGRLIAVEGEEEEIEGVAAGAGGDLGAE